MSEAGLVEHIMARLELRVQGYVQVRNPTTRAQLLQVISKFEERYSASETQGSNKNYNGERRDWDRRKSPDDRRSRNWRDAEVLDQLNDRRDNYRNTYVGIDPRGTKNSRTETGLTEMFGDSRVVADGISSEIRVRVTFLPGTREMEGGYHTLTVRTSC
ncbi:hypothetical protein TNCV_2632061 [Trichonephila clavipes]|nr:hypothetical protein TNCV_2632061 [Trichonephila clavipes]